jgi:hypothetical protein
VARHLPSPFVAVISFDVTIENEAPLESAISGLTRQLPFAFARAANNTANDVQYQIQRALPGEFTLRRADFITRTIYRTPGQDFATKSHLEAAVRVNPARDFLAKFEDGGTKTSTSGKTLPIPIIRATDKTLIIQRGDALSVQRLLAAINISGGKLLTPRVRKGKLRASIDPSKVFLVQSAKGTFIVQRTGPGTTRVLYAFERSVPIKPQLHFDDIAMQAAILNWDRNFAEAIEYAIATAR